MELSERNRWNLQLAQNRARLIDAYCGASAEQLTSVADEGGWTLAQILAHVTVWEQRVDDLLPLIFASESPPVPVADPDAMHGRAFADIAARGFEAVLCDLGNARAHMLRTLEQATDAEIARERRLPSGKPFTVRAWAIQELADHELEHAAQVRAARKLRQARFSIGPKPTLEAAFGAAHKFLMGCAAQIPSGQESTLAVTGTWTLRDVMGHLADWHQTIAESIEGALAGKPLTRVEFQKIQAYNDAHVSARKSDSWEKARGDYDRAWDSVNEALARIAQPEMARDAIETERGLVSMYRWLYIAPFHELEHGEFLYEFLTGTA